jgi:uncharacterized protein YjiS (DUF1127 family)
MTVLLFEARSVPGRGRVTPRRRARRIGRTILGRLRQWRLRARERAELASLDDRILTDIGVSRAEARFLSGKPFWRE